MALQKLPPDEMDISIAIKPVEPGCPFCGSSSIVMETSVNMNPEFGTEPVFQSRISCHCGLRLIENAATRLEAQVNCFKRWQGRAERLT